MIRPSKNMRYFAKQIATIVESFALRQDHDIYNFVFSDGVIDRSGISKTITVYFEFPNKRSHLSSYITPGVSEVHFVIDMNLLKDPTDLEQRFLFHYVRQAILHELIHIFDPHFKLGQSKSHEKYYLKPWEIPAWICSISELWIHARFEIELAASQEDVLAILSKIQDSIEDPFYFSEIIRQETSWRPWGQFRKIRPEFGSMLLPPREYLERENIREDLLTALRENYRELENEVEKMMRNEL